MKTPALRRSRGTRLHDKKVLALVLAGGKGSRMGPLTRQRAKPALPFGGTFRLIDFALSNCVNSGISDVWVLEEFELHTLNDHLGGGRPWDLDRTYGGLRVLPPYSSVGSEDPEDESEGGFASGNADAIYRQRTLIGEYDPELLLVLSADHLYTLDFSKVIAAHLERQASVTLVTTPLPPGEDPTRFGNVAREDSGRVQDFVYKPKKALDPQRYSEVTTEIFVYNVPELLETLERLQAEHGDLKDFGHHLLPALVAGGRAQAYPFSDYWRDVGLPEAYFQAHMDLLEGVGVDLEQPDWPLFTLALPGLPARLEPGAQVKGSMVSPGCRIAGEVSGSVLGPGVTVEAGATLERCVLLGHSHIASGVRLHDAIVDVGVDLTADFVRPDDALAVIGADAPGQTS